jgi:hypothetical protein
VLRDDKRYFEFKRRDKGDYDEKELAKIAGEFKREFPKMSEAWASPGFVDKEKVHKLGGRRTGR